MKKMETSTRLLKTGPMSSSSESMALYNSLGTHGEMLREEEDLAWTKIKDQRQNKGNLYQ